MNRPFLIISLDRRRAYHTACNMRQPLQYLRLPYPNHTTTQLVRPTPRYLQGNPRLLSFGYRRPPVRNVSTAREPASQWQWQYQRQWHTPRSFTSSATVNAKKGGSQTAESSNQSKLVPAIEAKVKEYDEAVKQASHRAMQIPFFAKRLLNSLSRRPV